MTNNYMAKHEIKGIVSVRQAANVPNLTLREMSRSFNHNRTNIDSKKLFRPIPEHREMISSAAAGI